MLRFDKLTRLLNSRIERRRRRRLPADVDVILSGAFGQSTARGIDLNRTGMGVLATQQVETGTLLFVRLPECGLMGFAFVRRCVAMAEGIYHLGLEFRESLGLDRSETALRPDRGSWCVQTACAGAAWCRSDDF
jgi:hypothetical protein